jgi:hypothetical protein
LEHQEAQEMAKVEGKRNVQGSRDALNERQAERNKFLQEYKEGTMTTEAKILASMKEAVTKLTFEYTQAKQTLRLEAEETAAATRADTQAKIKEIQAETRLSMAKEEGEAKTAMAGAEKQSDAHLIKSREFELRSKRLDV